MAAKCTQWRRVHAKSGGVHTERHCGRTSATIVEANRGNFVFTVKRGYHQVRGDFEFFRRGSSRTMAAAKTASMRLLRKAR